MLMALQIGIYLSQLRQYQQLPDYVDPSEPSEPVGVDPATGSLSAPAHPEVFTTYAPLPDTMTVEPLINVHKQRSIANVVKAVVAGQHLARRYGFVLDRKLQRDCSRLHAMDMVSLLKVAINAHSTDDHPFSSLTGNNAKVGPA